MNYVIYEPAYDADVRHWQITRAAQAANWLPETMEYDAVIKHPTEDKAALMVLVIDPQYYQQYYENEPTRGYNFEIFFSPQELAGSVSELPSDWGLNEPEPEILTE